MPWIKVWLHFVWSTKNRIPICRIRFARGCSITFDRMRSRKYPHWFHQWLHWAYPLPYFFRQWSNFGEDNAADQRESLFWINKNQLTKTKFGWQDEYFVASVSESNLEKVRRYIAKQEEHHSKVPFENEFDQLLLRAGFQRFKDGWCQRVLAEAGEFFGISSAKAYFALS